MKPIHIKFCLLCFVGLLATTGNGQDSTDVKKFQLSGYVKFMALGINSTNPDALLDEQFFHNRLEAKWAPLPHLEINAALRTRLIYGDLVKLTPQYGNLLSQSANDYFDFDRLFVDNQKIILHSVFDRLYVQYSFGNWELAAGRQRINWGITTLWNPNDLFNTYRFTDFDYEERPGSDALRVTWYRSWNSSVELAMKMADSFDESVMAMRVKFGLGAYDIQGVLGNYYKDIAIGGGFAGNLQGGSLRGEFSWFIPRTENNPGLRFTGTAEYQRSTRFNLFYTIGFLYNSEGGEQSILNLFNYNLSAQNLYPYSYTVFVQSSYDINPLLNCGLAVVYSINKVHPAFISPTLTYSAAENFDLSLTGQITAERILHTPKYHSPLQAYYLRFKYSF